MWLLLAFSGPILWAASTHIDKYLVERYFKNSDTAVLMVFTALIGVVMLPLIWWLEPGVPDVSPIDIVVLAAVGILYMGAMLFYLRAIQSEEASVVAPLFQASTLFTLLLAYIGLGEILTRTQLGGGALILGGAVVLSLDHSLRFWRFKLKLALLMLACTFVLALSSVIFKFFAIRDEFWITTFWTNVGQALFGLGILAVPAYRRHFLSLFRQSPGPVIAINGANELINLGGGLGVRFASLLAPVALVSAISSTSTLFVFAFGILLTHFFPPPGPRRPFLARARSKGCRRRSGRCRRESHQLDRQMTPLLVRTAVAVRSHGGQSRTKERRMRLSVSIASSSDNW
jgi:drug/metabolite transporter (DMT)-like permease